MLEIAEGRTSLFSLQTNPALREFGFIGIWGCINNKRVAFISQDIYSAECADNIEEAESYMMDVILKILK